MGGFINSQADAEICEVLNRRFSNDLNASNITYLDELRTFFNGKENLFSNSHKLNRVFHRLATSVTGGSFVPKNNHSRWRWFHLLKANLPNAVEKAIRDQLTAILSPAAGNPAGGVDYVIFSTVHQKTHSGDQFELWDGVIGGSPASHFNSSVPTPLGDANGNTYCALILECNVDQPLPDAPGEDDPPPSDGNNVEKGPIPFSKPKPKPMKKSPKKLSAKKRAKKSAKKVSRKGVKKTAKKGR
jgi:hypothetical protein